MSVKHALLGILAEQPRHGYEIKRTFDEKMGDFWSLNYGQIYTTLDRLQVDGLVEHDSIEQTDKPDKKVYRLTASGKEALNQWRAEPIKSEPRALRDELFVKILFMDPEQPEIILNLIRQQQSVYMAHMMQLTERKFQIEQRSRKAISAAPDEAVRKSAEHNRLVSSVLIDAALFHTEADIRWLRHCEAKIRDGMAP